MIAASDPVVKVTVVVVVVVVGPSSVVVVVPRVVVAVVDGSSASKDHAVGTRLCKTDLKSRKLQISSKGSSIKQQDLGLACQKLKKGQPASCADTE